MRAACSRCGGTTGATSHNLCAACLLRLAAMPEALAPEYEIETLLGEGRAGTSYLARALESDALLTVKIIAPREGSTDATAVADGIRADLMTFRHRAVARTHAVDVDAEGNLRIVRDYVVGRAISAWSAKADAADRQRVLEIVAAAISAAHAQGLFHGNVSPSNIIIGSGGQPFLVDLGAHMALRGLQGATLSAPEMEHHDRSSLDTLRAALTGPA